MASWSSDSHFLLQMFSFMFVSGGRKEPKHLGCDFHADRTEGMFDLIHEGDERRLYSEELKDSFGSEPEHRPLSSSHHPKPHNLLSSLRSSQEQEV